MNTDSLPFHSHVAEYEQWFEKFPHVFATELQAIKSLLPENQLLKALEIGVATGRFAKALGIHHGIEPAANMREVALKRGVYAIDAVAEDLPYKGLTFDYVLMNFCISYFDDPLATFVEAWRVLRYEGFLIVGFLEKSSPVAQNYERRKPGSNFYKQARFYSSEEVAKLLNEAGFSTVEFCQTLFHQPESLSATEDTIPGYGKGSYVLVKATKGKSRKPDQKI